MLVVLEIEFSISYLQKWTVQDKRKVFSSLEQQIDLKFLMRHLLDQVDLISLFTFHFQTLSKELVSSRPS